MSRVDPTLHHLLQEHHRYVYDATRLKHYTEALSSVVIPDIVVADLGSGTGILGLLALRAGAARVYAIDSTGMLEVCKAMAQANGVSDRLIPIRGHSREIELPEKADVIVCDQLSPFAYEAGLIECLQDAEIRHLKPGGVMLPSAIRFYLAPVASDSLFKLVSSWSKPADDLDMSCMQHWAAHCPYWESIEAKDLFHIPALALRMEITKQAPTVLDLFAEWTAPADAVLHGLAGWFEAELTKRVVLTNSPLSQDRIDREQTFMPFTEPMHVSAGGRITAKVSLAHEQRVATWHVQSEGNGTRAVRKQSSLQGQLLSKKDLQRMRPEFAPSLSERGAALVTVAGLFDGHHTLEEIERAVLQQHPRVFRSKEHAAVFVAEMLRYYSV